ncbi:MAG: serine/threonine-protein kinase, partial [Acidobacteriota bacterium]
VHRDLKPDNIMIAKKDGQDWVKVLDFGIAKLSAEDRRNDLTRSGMVVGTPVFMSPEQLSDERLDTGSDIYSFALIVYQMLTGCFPFRGDSAQAIMVKRLLENPLPISEVNPQVSVPPGVEAVLLAALARDREDRIPTIQRFVEQFELGVQGSSVKLRELFEVESRSALPALPLSPQNDICNSQRAKTCELLGRALYNNKQYLEAAQAFLQAFALDNSNVEMLAFAGFATELDSEKAMAQQIYDSFLNMFPNHEIAKIVRQIKLGAEPPPIQLSV